MSFKLLHRSGQEMSATNNTFLESTFTNIDKLIEFIQEKENLLKDTLTNVVRLDDIIQSKARAFGLSYGSPWYTLKIPFPVKEYTTALISMKDPTHHPTFEHAGEITVSRGGFNISLGFEYPTFTIQFEEENSGNDN